jgi:hypothetical protein
MMHSGDYPPPGRTAKPGIHLALAGPPTAQLHAAGHDPFAAFATEVDNPSPIRQCCVR